MYKCRVCGQSGDKRSTRTLFSYSGCIRERGTAERAVNTQQCGSFLQTGLIHDYLHSKFVQSTLYDIASSS